MSDEWWVLNTDGGSRGNPGPASWGVVLEEPGGRQHVFNKYLGKATSQVAEWAGLQAGLKRAVRLGVRLLQVRMDCKIIILQMTGYAVCRQPHLLPYYESCHALAKKFEDILFLHVPRTENTLADSLCNLALDDAGKGAT